jgi:hypothetical protein
MGARILQAVSFPFPVVPIVRHHHEQWDGRGYPDGLVATEIPLGARIISVVDCFDALTSDRPYRPKMTTEQAVALVRSRKGSFYDPAVVEKFIELIPELRSDDASFEEAAELGGPVVTGLTGGSRQPDRFLEVQEARSATAPGRVGAFIDERIAKISQAEACFFELNAAGDILTVAHATAGIRNAMKTFTIPVGAGISGWVAAHRSTIRHANAMLDLGELGHQLAVQSSVSTPIFCRGELRGTLTVYTPDAAGPSDAVIGDIGMLAQELGLLLGRAEAKRESEALETIPHAQERRLKPSARNQLGATA